MPTDQPRRRPAIDLLWLWRLACAVAVAGTVTTIAAQPSLEHLSPLVAKLAAGDRAFGVSTYDLSLENARSLARSNLDYVYVDMEHGPMDFVALHRFLLGLTDRAAVARNGDVAQQMTPLVRLAPYGRESPQWAVKQALDIGVMGVIFPAIETPEQALRAVQSMRYPQRRDAPYPEPRGLRGSGPTAAAWFWGLSTRDYVRRADTWPLNPTADLVALMMIETTDAVRNVEAIAAVPGVAGLYLGPSDLSNSLGLPRDDPRVEAAIQTVVDACLRHGIACGITANAADMPDRIEQGFSILGGGRAGGGLPAAVDAAVTAGRAVPD
jgi:4-hydroxy-2-oxoheptanedioate aldolase